LSNIPKSSIVTWPPVEGRPFIPIPTEMFVTPAGTTGVDHVACVQPVVDGCVGDCDQ
jgi:hypothetical protein